MASLERRDEGGTDKIVGRGSVGGRARIDVSVRRRGDATGGVTGTGRQQVNPNALKTSAFHRSLQSSLCDLDPYLEGRCFLADLCNEAAGVEQSYESICCSCRSK